MTTGSVAIEEVLLLLKIAFLALLYLFIWRIVRTASRDLRVPQESFVLPPRDCPASLAPPPAPAGSGRLVVVSSPALPAGQSHLLDSSPVTIGRGLDNEIVLGDTFASARHARLDPRQDGVWIEDLGSTNGTFVNGDQLRAPRRLDPGDRIRIGETELRFER